MLQPEASRRRVGRRPSRRGFSLVELLVVIFIIGVLVAILMPALNAARESSRKATCQSNLRQIGQGLAAHAERFNGPYCSGAFDWRRDGAVTEVGWVADLVNANIPVGKLLCPTNTALVSETYSDLLDGNPGAWGACINHKGRDPQTLPDGSLAKGPCYAIVVDGLAAGSAARTNLVQTKIFDKHFNTNYCAGWFLVRSGVLLNDQGALIPQPTAACPASTRNRSGTLGPLTRTRSDTAAISTSFIPIMGDAGSVGVLSAQLGDVPPGTALAKGFTNGPVYNPSMAEPNISAGTKDGPMGWWAAWMGTLQDYRGFAPVHGGGCNILYADGHVDIVNDRNGDGQLNNGFAPTATNGFADATIEIKTEEFHSRYALGAANP